MYILLRKLKKVKIEGKKTLTKKVLTKKIAGGGGWNLSCFTNFKSISYKYKVFLQFKANISRKLSESLIELCCKKEGWV